MDKFNILKELSIKNEARIILLVLDGLGGLPIEKGGPTELEKAYTPNLDQLARNSICGLVDPLGPGLTPGSGPAHLSLFGYDPFIYQIGRGVLASLGVMFDLKPADVAFRINFATKDEKGIIIDRRAGRLPTEENQRLCELLNKIKLGGVELFVRTVKEHRAVAILRGKDLSGDLLDSDPQKTGLPPRAVEPHTDSSASKYTAKLANEFISRANELLKDKHPANTVLLRGFAKYEKLPSMQEIYKLNPAAIANYPMYKGVAKLVGMEILKTGDTIDSEFEILKENYSSFDFFYIHIKKTDSYGEDGDFEHKVKIIEEVDQQIPKLLKLHPEVIIVTGDHSTPALLKSHSWHPVPTLLYSKYCRADEVDSFSEKACIRGGLGIIHSTNLLPLALGNALKLEKYGA